MDETTDKSTRLMRIARTIYCLTELLGYARGQRDIYNQLDHEEKMKYREMFNLREMTEELQTALLELRNQRFVLERELNVDLCRVIRKK